MSQGTVRITPKPTSSGSLSVTQADPNPYRVSIGATLSFEYPGFPVEVGNNVECQITSATTCNVLRVLELAK
jgi:hypothetical protein